jgi:FtsP/CotA-like multicopper oxidase with cupredoxin domain
MKPNEVQLWRIVNATVGGNQGTIAPAVFTALTAAGFQIKQIAQDGVQFRWENFEAQPFLSNFAPNGLTIAAGNRVDLLVVAPPAATATPLAAGELFFVNVSGAAVPAKGFIDQEHYPVFPEYLANLAAPKTPPHPVVFGWAKGTPGPGRTQGVPPHFQIDGKQFEQNGPVIDQCMELGTTEDWVLENHTTVAHPFHIHINPFQVLQIDAPAATTGKVVPYMAKNPVWQDVINIPPGVQVAGGSFVPGKVHIRHRFVDFVGTYVLHCHILAHEDRGMMQLVRVVTPENYKKGCQADIPMHH